MKRHSQNFVTRLETENDEDKLILEKIREAVSYINSQAQNRLLRVDVKPRKPIDKQDGYNGYGYGGNVLGGIDNAKYLDVYIRPVDQWWEIR